MAPTHAELGKYEEEERGLLPLFKSLYIIGNRKDPLEKSGWRTISICNAVCDPLVNRQRMWFTRQTITDIEINSIKTISFGDWLYVVSFNLSFLNRFNLTHNGYYSVKMCRIGCVTGWCLSMLIFALRLVSSKMQKRNNNNKTFKTYDSIYCCCNIFVEFALTLLRNG